MGLVRGLERSIPRSIPQSSKGGAIEGHGASVCVVVRCARFCCGYFRCSSPPVAHTYTNLHTDVHTSIHAGTHPQTRTNTHERPPNLQAPDMPDTRPATPTRRVSGHVLSMTYDMSFDRRPRFVHDILYEAWQPHVVNLSCHELLVSRHVLSMTSGLHFGSRPHVLHDLRYPL